jgi:hypothetical protein
VPLRVYIIAIVLSLVGASELRAAESLLKSEPLAARSLPKGKTLFTLLPASETGILTQNDYNDPRIWGERYNEFPVGAIGTGVAVGDYDGDGRPDIFVVSKAETCRLFRNLGNWKFEDVTDRAGVGDKGDAARVWKQGATFVDVNNDGLLDLYVCRFGAPNLLYINQGDGTFREEAAKRGLAVNDASGMAAFCDYDGDGWLDVFIQTNILDAVGHPNGQRNYLFHNNGDGTFTDVTEKAGIRGEAHGHSATWWDFDGDGRPDIYVANDFAAPDVLYHNNGDGTFTDVIDQVMPCQPYHSMGADIGDVNNTGRLDLFVGEMARSTHEREYRTIAETRSQPKDEPIDHAGIPQYMRNVLYLNNGTGHFQEVAQIAGLARTDWTWAARLEDFDNDGRVDLVLTNGMVREYDNVDLRARAMLAESSADRVQIMRTAPIEADTHFAYRNRGDLRFEDVSKAWGIDQKGVSFGAATGDFDGDGDLDIVYTNYQAGLTVLRNDSVTGHRLVIALRGTRSNRFGVGASVEIETDAGVQTRTLTLARGYLSSSEPILHFGLGETAMVKTLTVKWPSGCVQVFHQIDADRRFTITEPATNPAREKKMVDAAPEPLFKDVTAERGLSGFAREADIEETNSVAFSPFRFNRRGPALAVGKLRSDADETFVVGGTTLDSERLARSADRIRFSETAIAAGDMPSKVNDGPILMFDADGDGNADLLITKSGATAIVGSTSFQPKLWLGDGTGRFRPATDDALPEFPVAVGALVAADFDRDGQVDVFVGGRFKVGQYPLTPKSALWRNHGGHFEDVTDTIAPGLRDVGMVTSALWTDVDSDGWLDLLIATEWGGVHFFKNMSGHGFEERSAAMGFAAAGMGWWTSIAAADFNGDGKLDYVVGNAGLNTRYQASDEHPALVYIGRFSSRPGLSAIEAYYEGDSLYPWRTRRELGAKIPEVLKRFPSNDAFAKATLQEIIDPTKLNAAARLTMTELRSGVFLSQPDGKYKFRALPRMAQIAPLQGIVAGDFDGDGLADIYAVQNSYAPIYSVGRFTGGVSQFLRGDGRGNFEIVEPKDSGLVVPGDAKALALTDLRENGVPTLLATRNNDTMLGFEARPRAGRNFFAIKLHGRDVGNPFAIGARVSVFFKDGHSQTNEVYAGGGYESESSATLFFGYANDAPPERTEVRWPSGREASYRWNDHNPEKNISED